MIYTFYVIKKFNKIIIYLKLFCISLNKYIPDEIKFYANLMGQDIRIKIV